MYIGFRDITRKMENQINNRIKNETESDAAVVWGFHEKVPSIWTRYVIILKIGTPQKGRFYCGNPIPLNHSIIPVSIPCLVPFDSPLITISGVLSV